MRIPLSRNQTFFTFTKGICTMLWIIYAFGFPLSWISKWIKVEKRGKGVRLNQSCNAGQYEKNQELIHVCWWKISNCYEGEPMMLETFIWNFMVQRGLQLRNISHKVECYPYLRGRVRIRFFVLHTINLYKMEKGISISRIKIDRIHQDRFSNQTGYIKR